MWAEIVNPVVRVFPGAGSVREVRGDWGGCGVCGVRQVRGDCGSVGSTVSGR